MGIIIHGKFEVNGKEYSAKELQSLLEQARKVAVMESKIEALEVKVGVKELPVEDN